MSEEASFLAAFAHDWDLPTLDARIAAVASTVKDAGWSSSRVEIASPGANARADIGTSPLREGGAGARRLLLNTVSRFSAYGAFVIPEAQRGDVGPLLYEGAGDVVIVPLVARDEPLGTIVAVGAAGEARVRALRALGDVLAIAVDMDRRLRRAEGDAERAAVIARVGESIRSSLDREEILRAVARDVRVAFGSARCAIYVRDERNPNLARVIAADDPGIIRAELPDRFTIAGTLLNKCLGVGQIVRIERGATAADQAQLVPFGAAAMLLVPFVVAGKIDAGLSVQYASEHAFDERDLLLMRTIAMHVGLALANSRLYERERQARRRAEDIERNVRTLKETRSVVEILQLLLEMIAREYELNGSAWSVENGRLTCRVVTARPGSGPTVGATADAALRVVETLLESDVIPIASRDDGAWASIVGVRGGFALPLRVDARLLGMLVFDGIPRDTIDREDREAYMRTVAAHGALALANANAFEAERRFAQESAAISEAGHAVLLHNELESLGEAMCRFALDLAGADVACLYVPRDGSLRRVGALSLDGACRLPTTLAGDDALVRHAAAGGDSTSTVIEGEPTVVVPLRAGAGAPVAGFYVCVRTGRLPAPFDRGALRLLESLGALVALGLRNVDLYRALAENNEFKDDLLAMFTHDFKGPLTVIQGYTELLLEEELSVDVRASIETIHGQSRRLAKLAEDALVLARTQAAGFSLQRAVSDLNTFVGESVDAHDPGESRIEFSCPDGETLVWIDRTRLKHVIDNVIANALKYSVAPVRVDVLAAGGEAIIRVADRGIGIPEADLERIFVRFGRGTNARARGIAGTGVGLYVARKIVDVHGGRIGVTSKENDGSTFEIILPLAAVPAGRPAESPLAV
ncbi:MAG: ATP-binding protein [Candidatus Velthaea sp.]